MRTLFVLIVLSAAALGQTAAAPSFEVASVKALPPGAQWREPKISDDRVDLPNVTLRYCLAMAYGLKEFQVSGPPWIAEARYEIVAKGPAGTRREQLPAMMQTLLAHRFQLVARRETKEFPVYTLTVNKGGPKLKESPPSDVPVTGANFGISMTGAGVGRLECRHADMTALVNTLPRFVGRPVVNLTEISGRYDFDLEFSPDDMKGMSVPAPPDAKPIEFGMSIFTSLQKVGLKLDSRKLPLDAVVVDRAERTPTEN
jgi:uncharacterized protein (TIGR03435 family)